MSHEELDLTERERMILDRIEDGRRLGRRTLEVAGDLRQLTGDHEAVDRVLAHIEAEGRRNQLLRIPGGMESLAYRRVEGEARTLRWYTGPQSTDRYWPAYQRRLEQIGMPSGAIQSVDHASTKIVAYLGPPDVYGLQKKGLVLGYVQSGKTANFTAVLAKAADAGYRLFIVLSGIHNALRRQTQRRLDDQLIGPHREKWTPLTTATKDFGYVPHGGQTLSGREMRSLAVTKKNPARLRRLVEWLEDIPEEIRRECPALIIDDEADQATPNTARNGWDRTTINRLIVEVRSLLPTSTYLAYTATPFANIFIDPQDETDLYPDDFIISLERPDGYFGAEALFGRASLDDEDDPDDGLDMVRVIEPDEALVVRPPRGREDRNEFAPPVDGALADAVRRRPPPARRLAAGLPLRAAALRLDERS